MARFIYNDGGDPVAFVRGRFLHGLDGGALARLDRSHVHRLSGEYVGELYGDMVVDRGVADPGNLGPSDIPANAGLPGHAGNRGARDSDYRDVSVQLLS